MYLKNCHRQNFPDKFSEKTSVLDVLKVMCCITFPPLATGIDFSRTLLPNGGKLGSPNRGGS